MDAPVSQSASSPSGQAVGERRRLAILGCTGSVGRQTLDVVAAFPNRFAVVGLAARTDSEALRAQAVRFGIERPVAFERDGAAALVDLVTDPRVDLVVAASSGYGALAPTLAALQAGKTVALANKEVLVAAGELVMAEVSRGRGSLVPVDSEHAAIWQCLAGQLLAEHGTARIGQPPRSLRRLILTASGGPFRTLPPSELARATARAALEHPTWSMGNKVTIDSATLMNKGFEVIEARWLFGAELDQIEVVVHPQSVVHSLVEFADGSCLAQLASPDMRLPIQQALFWPERPPAPWPRLDWATARTLHFEPPDTERFPCLRLAYAAARRGGLVPAALIGADEEAVRLFLTGRIGFLDVPRLLERVVEEAPHDAVRDVELATEVALWGGRRVAELAKALPPPSHEPGALPRLERDPSAS